MRFEVLPARYGECFLIRGDAGEPGLILVDGGPARTYEEVLRPRLKALREEAGLAGQPLVIDLIVVSHSDDAHMIGIVDLLVDLAEHVERGLKPPVIVKELWFNAFDRVLGDGSALQGLGELPPPSQPATLDSRERADGAQVIASFNKGRRLLALAEKLMIPLNPGFPDRFVETGAGDVRQRMIAGISLTILGPLRSEIDQLRRKHAGWLSFQNDSDRKITSEGVLDSLLGSSVSSATSIVLLVEQHGKTALITGDARGDRIVRGLEDAGLLDAHGQVPVDILKVPHHGGDPYLGELVDRVPARTYVFSANIESGGPEPATIERIMARQTDKDVALCLPQSVASIDTFQRVQRDHRRGPARNLTRDTAIEKSIKRVVESRAESILTNFSSEKRRAELQAGGGAADLSSFNVMHNALGSETLTIPWVEMIELVEGHSGKKLPEMALKIIASRVSERDKVAWIDLKVAPGLGKSIWIALNAERWQGPPEAITGSCAVLLPHDAHHDFVVRLECSFEPVPGYNYLAPRNLSARLGEPPAGGSGERLWKPLWEAQRNALIFSNAEGARQLVAQERDFINIISRKMESPLAAAIAAAVLIRANLLDSLEDWPRNLANWFPELPDGPVLWAETLLRRQRRNFNPPVLGSRSGSRERGPDPRDVRDWLVRDDTREALAMFLELHKRGPPLLGTTLAMAVQQASLWAMQREAMSGSDADDVSRICAMIDKVASLAESETLFASFRSAKPHFEPPGPYRR